MEYLNGGDAICKSYRIRHPAPHVLDAARYDTYERGAAANYGLLAHNGFGDAVDLGEIVRKGEGEERLLGVLTRLRTYVLKEDDAFWITSLQVDMYPNPHMEMGWGEAHCTSFPPKTRSGRGTRRSPHRFTTGATSPSRI